MEQKTARVIWSRGQYSDVERLDIVDPSPLKQGQKVKVIWGERRKELMAVFECYLLEQEEMPTVTPQTTKAKRKLVSNSVVELYWRHIHVFNLL